MFLNSLQRNLCKQKLKNEFSLNKGISFTTNLLKIQECIYYSEYERISSNVSIHFDLDEKWTFEGKKYSFIPKKKMNVKASPVLVYSII